MNENDPLKELMKSLPDIDPPVNLRTRIWNEIRSPEKVTDFWVLKPAFALVSLLVVTLLGTVLSLNLVPGSPDIANTVRTQKTARASSPLLRWAQPRSDVKFLSVGRI